MSDSFSDDNFKEAARLYQNIKAPSDLRERVLRGAAAQKEGMSAVDKTVLPLAECRKKHSFRPVYKALSLAACLAIMVTVLPDWMPDADELDSSAVSPIGIVGEDIVLQTDESELPEIDLASDEGGMTAVWEPEGSSEAADAVPEKSPNLPEPKETKTPPAVSTYDVKSSEPEKKEDEDVFEEKEAPEEMDGAGIAIHVGKLIPFLAAEDSVLQDMEVRLVSAEDGICKVEITTADSQTTELTVSKNVEDGHWEITGAAEE